MLSHQFRLKRRPTGEPTATDFEFVGLTLPPVTAGTVRVRNEFISVDPYMRGRMSDRSSYVEPYPVGESMTGPAVGRVVVSEDPRHAVGDLVTHSLGWRDVAQGPAELFSGVDGSVAGAPSIHLGALGGTGHTAYAGMLHIARMRPGDVVFVSGAAGAVGSIAGQIARLRGAARVIGSAGSAEKVSRLTGVYGFDAAFDYHQEDLAQALAEAAPTGIDVYFDNVGGDHLEAALQSFRHGGRAAICGAISQYNATESGPGPRYMENLVFRSVTLQGFVLKDLRHTRADFERDMSAWLNAGKIVQDETVVDGLDRTVDAFLGLFRGDNTGKMLVRL